MSSIHTPKEKKRLAYERDHYNRNGESNKAWRKAKPLKKTKARKAFRKASKDLLRVVGTEPDGASDSVVRKQNSIRQRRVNDWGAIHLREFVATRRVRNSLNKGAKKARRKAHETRLKHTG
jgi:hypothetical protein